MICVIVTLTVLLLLFHNLGEYKFVHLFIWIYFWLKYTLNFVFIVRRVAFMYTYFLNSVILNWNMWNSKSWNSWYSWNNFFYYFLYIYIFIFNKTMLYIVCMSYTHESDLQKPERPQPTTQRQNRAIRLFTSGTVLEAELCWNGWNMSQRTRTFRNRWW